MKKIIALGFLVLFLVSCSAPVLKKDLLDQARRPESLEEIAAGDAVRYTGRLFALGGIIVNTRVAPRGSIIEALYVPVDENGYLREPNRTAGRFLAFYPREQGILDPVIYAPGRHISLLADFVELQKGTIGEMEYLYPLFRIRDLYLWDERRNAYPSTFFHFGIFTGF